MQTIKNKYKMEQKIKRFIELSKEFTISSKEVYENIPSETFYISSGQGWAISSSVDDRTPEPTKLEKLKKLSEDKVSRAERYEEYLKLRELLWDYYDSLEKLKQ